MTRSAPHTTESALATMFVLTILYQAYFVWLDFRIDKPINAWLNVGGIVFMSGLLISLRLRRLQMSRAAYYTVPFVAFWQAVFLLMGLASPAATPITTYTTHVITVLIAFAFMPLRLAGVLTAVYWAALAAVTLTRSAVDLSTFGDVAYITLLAGFLGTHGRQLYEERRRAETLEDLAHLDVLTELPNRRAMLRALRAREGAAPGAEDPKPDILVLLDIDHFKAVNDGHGHETGDAVLRHVAGLLRAGTRHRDVLCRWGGEEYLLLLVETSLDEATFIVERLLADVRHARPMGLPPVTLSAGLSVWRPPQTAEAAIAHADARLYEAKRAGRDRWAA